MLNEIIIQILQIQKLKISFIVIMKYCFGKFSCILNFELKSDMPAMLAFSRCCSLKMKGRVAVATFGRSALSLLSRKNCAAKQLNAKK